MLVYFYLTRGTFLQMEPEAQVGTVNKSYNSGYLTIWMSWPKFRKLLADFVCSKSEGGPKAARIKSPSNVCVNDVSV